MFEKREIQLTNTLKEPAKKMRLTYKELQDKLREYRYNGMILQCKLNDKAELLEAELARIEKEERIDDEGLLRDEIESQAVESFSDTKTFLALKGVVPPTKEPEAKLLTANQLKKFFKQMKGRGYRLSFTVEIMHDYPDDCPISLYYDSRYIGDISYCINRSKDGSNLGKFTSMFDSSHLNFLNDELRKFAKLEQLTKP